MYSVRRGAFEAAGRAVLVEPKVDSIRSALVGFSWAACEIIRYNDCEELSPVPEFKAVPTLNRSISFVVL